MAMVIIFATTAIFVGCKKEENKVVKVKKENGQIVSEISQAMQEGMNEEIVNQLKGTDNLPQMVEFLKNSTLFNERLAEEIEKLTKSPEKQEELVARIKDILEGKQSRTKTEFP